MRGAHEAASMAPTSNASARILLTAMLSPVRAGVFCFLIALLVPFGLACAQENIVLDGEHVIVHSLTVTGNTSFTEEVIVGMMQTQPPPSWYYEVLTLGSVAKSYVSITALVQDSTALVEFYRDNGYLFAHVGYTVTIDTPKVRADVAFHIDEGKRCSVASIAILDSGALSSSEREAIQGILQPCIGAPYSTARLRDSIFAGIDLLQNSGYRFARISGTPVVKLNPDRSTVAITVPVVPGPQYRFGETTIHYDSSYAGECFTDNAVYLEREYKRGELYSRSKAYRTEDNLRRLGVFDNVRLELLTQDADSTGVAPARIDLKFGRQIDFTPSLEANNERGTFNFGFGASVAHHNIFCAAQELSLNGSYEVPNFLFGYSRIDLTLKFSQPRVRLGDLLDYHNTSLLFTGGFSRSTYPYARTQWALATSLNIRQAEFTALVPQIAYVQVTVDTTIRLPSNTTDSSLISQEIRSQRQPNLLFSVALSRDNTNNIFVPSSGSNGAVVLKMNVLNTPYFFKAEATQRWYVGWGTQSVFAFRLHGGAIARFGDVNRDVIVDERFVVGGAYSVRGWGLYQLGIGLDSPRAGYTLLEGNAEWRYQWFRLPDRWITRVILNRLSHSFFIDCGQVWSERRKVDWLSDMPRQLALAIGVEFRYDTPVGPLRLSLGYKIYDPDVQEFVHLAEVVPKWPFISIVHPQLQLAIGNAF